MSTEDNKAMVRRYIEEVHNQGHVAVIDELMAPNLVDHMWLPTNAPVPAGTPQSLEEIKHFIAQWHTTFPDLHVTIEVQVAEGDMVVTRTTWRGTHTGEYRGIGFKGIPPTGRQVMWTETWISRIADGKIVELWFNEDAVSRLLQVGALPTPGEAK
jgi:predicted ester cyclase